MIEVLGPARGFCKLAVSGVNVAEPQLGNTVDRQPSNPEVMAELEREILSFDPSREIDREIKLPFGGGQMSHPSVAETNRSVPDEPRQRSLRNLKRSSLREADGAHQHGHERQLELEFQLPQLGLIREISEGAECSLEVLNGFGVC